MKTFVKAFLIERQSQNVSKKTLEWHKYSLQRFSRFLEREGHDTNPLTWTKHTLREFVVHLQDEGLSDYTVRTYANSVWSFCRFLYHDEVIDIDIAEAAKKPRLPNNQKTAFSESEVLNLVSAASKTRNRLRDMAILLVLLDTGMRNSELCNLTINDLMEDEGFLIIRKGKGNKSRSVPVSVQTLVAISKYRSRIKGTPASDYLFLSKKHTKLTPSGLLQLVRRIAASAGVEDVHPHRFRHTSALYFLRNGGDSLVLQKILGHTTLQQTQRYVNMLTDDMSTQHKKASPVHNLKLK